MRAAVAQRAYAQNPTEENRRRYEEAHARDQHNLKVEKVLLGLVLILITGLLWRTAVRLRSGPVRPGGAQPGAPPNGGPGEPSGSSGVGDGPPSVS